MARNTDIAQVPTNPNVTVRLEWEKKDERGVLVFSDSRYEPISVEVEELKGTHQPIIRIIYYRGGTGRCTVCQTKVWRTVKHAKRHGRH